MSGFQVTIADSLAPGTAPAIWYNPGDLWGLEPASHISPPAKMTLAAHPDVAAATVLLGEGPATLPERGHDSGVSDAHQFGRGYQAGAILVHDKLGVLRWNRCRLGFSAGPNRIRHMLPATPGRWVSRSGGCQER